MSWRAARSEGAALAAWSAYVAALALYAASFVLLYPKVGTTAAVFFLVPAIVAGWGSGLRGGVVGAALTLPVNLVLFSPALGVAAPVEGVLPHALGLVASAAIGGFVGHARDLREALHDKTRQLAESEAMHRQLVEQTPEGIVVLRDGVVVFANPAMARILAVDAARSLVGRTLVSFAPFEDREAMRAGVVAPVPDRLVRSRARLVAANGRLVEVDLTGVGITHEGAPARVVVVRDPALQARAHADDATPDANHSSPALRKKIETREPPTPPLPE